MYFISDNITNSGSKTRSGCPVREKCPLAGYGMGPYDPKAMLFDYLNRQWAGLFRNFYYKCWKMYFDFLRKELAKSPATRYVETSGIHHRFGRPSNEANDFYKMISRWEYEWCEGTASYPATAVGHTYPVARQLFEKWYKVADEIYSKSKKIEKENIVDPDKQKKLFGID